MRTSRTALPEILVVEPEVFRDDRGIFYESWNERGFAEAGIEARFVQENHSSSSRGVLRGLHYQLVRPQGKLIRVVRGRAWDVAIDLRRSSARFGRWAGVELSADNRKMLWVPAGFGHGFLSLEDDTEILYKCTDYYAPEHERGILWSDPAIAIDWPLPPGAQPLLAGKDAVAPCLDRAEVYR